MAPQLTGTGRRRLAHALVCISTAAGFLALPVAIHLAGGEVAV
jgi:hypothetical protein